MKQIALNGKAGKGKFALVDDDLFEELSQHKWHLHNRGYVSRTMAGYRGKLTLMHRQILDTPSGMHSDHINHDKLDNRRSNLRVCTHLENLNNPKKKGYVYLEKRSQKWRSCVRHFRKTYHVGTFKTQLEAKTALQSFISKLERKII